jgi:endonuclease IV
MNNFFLDYFSAEERKRIGITIDTCHVFNAGNDPLKYMQAWIKEGSVKIALCHWNDATNFFGVGVEGHHNPDHPGGAIGYEMMKDIAALCAENDIPFVFEPGSGEK